MTLTIPTPPADLSGGFFKMQYTNGNRLHTARLHVNPFTASTQAYTTTIGSEGHVNDTIAAYMAEAKLFFTGSWQFSCIGLWQNVGGVATPVFPTPSATASGTATAATYPELDETECIFNFHTLGGMRARAVLISANVYSAGGLPNIVVVGGGLVDPSQTLVSYLGGTGTQIVGHDGTKFGTVCHFTYALNRRLRRHYGHA